MDTDQTLAPFAWYAGCYQQYHTVILLLTELYRTPDILNSDRLYMMVDHVFGHCYGVERTRRCADLLHQLKENFETFLELRNIKVHHQGFDNNAQGALLGTSNQDSDFEALAEIFPQETDDLIIPKVAPNMEQSWTLNAEIFDSFDPANNSYDWIDSCSNQASFNDGWVSPAP